MKKLLLLVFFLAAIQGFSQDSANVKKYKNQLKFSLGNLFDNTLLFNWEQQLKNQNALLIGLGPLYTETSDVRKSGYRAEFQYKLYITRKESENAVSRIYVAPFLNYKYIEKKNTYESPYIPYTYPTYYFHSFCPGIIAGINIISYHRLVFDMYLGGGMKRTFDGDFLGKIDYDNYNIWQPGYNGVIPRIGFEMGITL